MFPFTGPRSELLATMQIAARCKRSNTALTGVFFAIKNALKHCSRDQPRPIQYPMPADL
jgi:hypothetical protein